MYRAIHETYWSDPTVRLLNIEESHLFLYCITNRYNHVSGLYYIPLVTMAYESKFGTPSEGFRRGLATLDRHNLVHFDHDFEVCWVVNFLKHQSMSPNLKIGVSNHLGTLHKTPLIHDFIEKYRDYNIPNLDRYEGVAKGLPRGCQAPCRSDTDTGTDTVSLSVPSFGTVPDATFLTSEKTSETIKGENGKEEKDPLSNVKEHAEMWMKYAVGEAGNPTTKQVMREKCYCELKRLLSDLGNEDLFRQAIERGMSEKNQGKIKNSHAYLIEIAQSIVNSPPSKSNEFRPPPIPAGPPTYPQVVERLKIYLESLQRWKREGIEESKIIDQIKTEGGCNDETAGKYYREYIAVGNLLDRVGEDSSVKPDRKRDEELS